MDTLLHGDVRADNILITTSEVIFVDWPSACIGAPLFDAIALLPSPQDWLDVGPAGPGVMTRECT